MTEVALPSVVHGLMLSSWLVSVNWICICESVGQRTVELQKKYGEELRMDEGEEEEEEVGDRFMSNSVQLLFDLATATAAIGKKLTARVPVTARTYPLVPRLNMNASLVPLFWLFLNAILKTEWDTNKIFRMWCKKFDVKTCLNRNENKRTYLKIWRCKGFEYDFHFN